MFVTDTHALVYHAEQKPSYLGKASRRVFQEADNNETMIYVPTVVLWELSQRALKGQFSFPVPFDLWCRELSAAPGFSIVPLEWQHVQEARGLSFNDPFDCLIAGTAIQLGIPLITKDAEIRESGLVETIW
jgi:PIN domain nuclease of toxin-antitoxin system